MLAVSVLGIVLLAVLAVVVLLGVGGYVAATRRRHANDAALRAELASAEDALTQAHALDKGWDRERLMDAALSVAEQRFGEIVGTPQLVRVIDNPGVSGDEAVFRVQTADGREHRVTLGRAGGVWGPS